MKLKPDFAKWKLFVNAHVKLCVGVIFFLVAALVAGGGFSFYRYRTGVDYAFKNLHQALLSADRVKLAYLFDFSSLSEDFTRAVSEFYPQAAADEAQRAELRDEAQRVVLAALESAGAGGGGHGDGGHGKGDKKSDKHAPASSPRKISDPIPFLPEDIAPQIAAGLKMEKRPEGVILRSQFTNNVLQRAFSVELKMEHRWDGWVVTRLLNAREQVALFKEGSEALKAEDEARLAEKNAKIINEMQEHFHLPICSVSAGPVGNDLETLMMIGITAENAGKDVLYNVNLWCRVSGAGGQPVLERRLNAVQRTFPKGKFDYTWRFLLDADSAEAKALLGLQPLSCTVELNSMTLGDGRLLYPRSE